MNISSITTSRVLVSFRSAILAGILLILVLTAFRVICLNVLTGEVWDILASQEKMRFWFTSLRFDLKFASCSLLPVVLLGLLLPERCLRRRFASWSAFYCGILFFCAGLGGIANFYWIQTYGRHFDTMVFGVVNEDTMAVIRSIWDGYPVLWELFTGVATGLVAWLLLRRIFSFVRNCTREQGLWGAVLCFLLLGALWAFFIRGDVGKFPLRRADAAATTSTAVNTHVPSGILAFVWTVSDHFKESRIRPAVPEDLADAAAFFGLPAAQGDYRKVLERHAAGLLGSRPHVVLAVMESMSTDMLLLDDPATFDVYGSLRQVLALPGVRSFEHVLSEGDGTIDSLGRILVRQGDNLDHSVSRFGETPFFTSAAMPFREAGYHTVLVTAGSRGWRDLGRFAEANGFDEVVDEASIRLADPGAEGATWGLFDGAMFSAARRILDTSDRPVFMVLLSVTNHPPFTVPGSYQITNMSRPNAAVDARYPAIREIYSMYETFRYANDQLGDFILGISRDDRLAGNTVIAATGDHNVRGLNVYQDTGSVILGHQVPLIFYLPESGAGLAADLARPASHKDILPTLFDLALEGTAYHYPGCGLFTPGDCPFAFAYNGDVTVTPEGACFRDGESARSYAIEGFRAVAAADNGACRTAGMYRDLTEWFYRLQTAGLGSGKR